MLKLGTILTKSNLICLQKIPIKQKQLLKAIAQKLVVLPFFEITSDHKL